MPSCLKTACHGSTNCRLDRSWSGKGEQGRLIQPVMHHGAPLRHSVAQRRRAGPMPAFRAASRRISALLLLLVLPAPPAAPPACLEQSPTRSGAYSSPPTARGDAGLRPQAHRHGGRASEAAPRRAVCRRRRPRAAPPCRRPAAATAAQGSRCARRCKRLPPLFHQLRLLLHSLDLGGPAASAYPGAAWAPAHGGALEEMGLPFRAARCWLPMTMASHASQLHYLCMLCMRQMLYDSCSDQEHAIPINQPNCAPHVLAEDASMAPCPSMRAGGED